MRLQLVLVQLERPLAVEHDKELLLGGMAVRRSGQRPGLELEVLQPGPARATGGREVAAPATAAHVRLDVPRRDDRRRSLGFGLGPHELGLAVPRVAVGVHLDPAGARPHRAAAWQLAAREVFAGAKSEHVQAAIAAANRVLVEVVVDDAVAGADLVRLLVDPRQTGAAEHVEDLLCLAMDVRGRRHLARTEFHPSHTTARAPRGGAEVGPGAGHLAPLVAPLLDVVPVRDSHWGDSRSYDNHGNRNPQPTGADSASAQRS